MKKRKQVRRESRRRKEGRISWKNINPTFRVKVLGRSVNDSLETKQILFINDFFNLKDQQMIWLIC